jgi:hypothetical protein
MSTLPSNRGSLYASAHRTQRGDDESATAVSKARHKHSGGPDTEAAVLTRGVDDVTRGGDVTRDAFADGQANLAATAVRDPAPYLAAPSVDEEERRPVCR